MFVELVVVALAMLVGDAARHALGITTRGVERVAFAGGLGLAILSTVGFVLMTASAFAPAPVLVAAAALGLTAMARRDRRSFALPRPTRSEIPFLFAIAAPIVALLPFLPGPETAFDAVYYHLPIARDLARLGTLPYEPYLIFTGFPLFAETVYGVAALFGAIDAARVMQFACGLLGGAVAFSLASRRGGTKAGLTAAFIWFATPLVMWEMTVAYVDLVAALFVGLAAVCALRWLDTRGRSDAAMSGLFIGFGLATKLTVALVAAPLLLAMLVVALRRRGGLAAPALAALAMFLAAAPQYGRAFVLTGDPVFPYLNGIFRSPLWDPVNDSFDHLQFGAGSGLLDLLLLPLRLVTDPGRFDQNPLPYLLAFPPIVAVAVLLAFRRGGMTQTRFLAFVVAGTTVAWFASAQYARYLLPVFPLGAALCGIALAPLLDGTARRVARAGVHAAVVVACIVAVPVFLLPSRTVLEPLPVRYDLGQETRDEYLSRVFRHYAMYRWLSSSLVVPGMILGLAFSEAPIMYSDVPIYRAETTLAGRRVLETTDAAAALSTLRAEGFRYVLFDRAPRPNPSGGHLVATERFVRENLGLVHEEGVLALYAVPPR